MNKFEWGHVIDVFDYDFDGKRLEVVKYHPWEKNGCQVLSGNPDKNTILYHSDYLHESFPSLFGLLIAFIARENIGLNQQALSTGIARSLLCLT